MIKLDKPINDNYAVTIARVVAVVPLEGRDRIVGVPIHGHQAIVSKGWAEGDLGVFIPAESQLSPEFASANNMHTHPELNADPSVKGYLEDNRRVRSIRLGGHRSSALFLPLSSLEFTGVDITKFAEGDTFDHIGDIEIVRKYEIRSHKPASTKGNQAPKPRRVDKRHMPEHVDTANYWRAQHSIREDAYIWVTQKLHGTSIRIANTIVKRKLSRRERLARWFGAKVQETEYSPVYGSRRSIKDANDPDQRNFYDTDVWTIEGKRLDGLVPAGYVVYGELVGWAHQEPIQKGYTYNLPKGTAQLFIYRVAQVNPDGVVVDLSWVQLEEFCRNTGLKPVPLLWAGFHQDFDVDAWMDKRYNAEGYRHAVPLDPGESVDEGVVIRVDGLVPRLLKAKAPLFFEHETQMHDQGVEDLESAEAA